MSSIEKWNRNSFGIEAARITDENLDEIANWCEGRVVQEAGGRKRYILLSVDEGSRVREAKAYVGEWVVITDDDRIALYTNDEKFRKDFKQNDTLSNSVGAMLKDVAVMIKSGRVAEEDIIETYTKKITEFFAGE